MAYSFIECMQKGLWGSAYVYVSMDTFLDCRVMKYMGGRKRNFLLGRQKGQKEHDTHSAVLWRTCAVNKTIDFIDPIVQRAAIWLLKKSVLLYVWCIVLKNKAVWILASVRNSIYFVVMAQVYWCYSGRGKIIHPRDGLNKNEPRLSSTTFSLV